MKKRFAAFVSTVLAAVLCACSAAPKDVLPNKAAQPTEAPTQQAQTTQAAPTEQPTPEPDLVQQLLEEMTLEQKVGQLFLVRPDSLVGGACAGFADAGIACTLKHFPGHGDTSEDTHVGTVTLNKTLDDLRSCELVPFAQNVNNAPLIMAAHITVPQVTGDDTPASLSSVMLTDLLRGELGYQGLIVTDSLAMQAITDMYTPGQAAVKALQAGADLLLMPNGLADAYTAVLEAVQDGTIPQQRLDESVQRILQCKYQYGILTQ